MRILQRRARLPTLITSYWDHNTLRAQLCFSYATSSQPTFDSHSRTACCLSVSTFRGWAAPDCYLSIHGPERIWDWPQTVWDTSLPFCRSTGIVGFRWMDLCAEGLQLTLKKELSLFVVTNKTSWFGTLTQAVWGFCVTHFALQCSINLVLCAFESSRWMKVTFIFWKDPDLYLI